MKINMKQVFCNLYSEPMFEQINGEQKEITLGMVSCSALLNVYPDEPNVSGVEKSKRYKLAMAIVDQDEVDLSIDDVALLKKLTSKNPSPLIVGQSVDMLEGINYAGDATS